MDNGWTDFRWLEKTKAREEYLLGRGEVGFED
jgi:hypothetical protein